MISLRPYQRTALDQVHAAIDRHPILVLPTGGGKTFTAVQLVIELGRPTLWLAHRRELIQQAAVSLAKLGLDVGIIMASCDPRPRAQVQVASIQTLRKRALPPAGLVIVDEAHHARAATYRQILEGYPSPASIVGLTATPWRLDGKGLGDVFGEIVVGAYPDELCADGTLVEPTVYAPASPDLSGVTKQHGEYNLRQVGERVNKAKLIGDVVEQWMAKAAGKRTVVYATNVAHSQSIVAAFKSAGVKAEHLDGSTPKGLRDAILHRLRVGYTTVVSNVQVLEEGWDLPALEVGVIARPTASLCLHLQMIGRIMRAADGKGGAIVLDHAGNHLRHGSVTQRIQYNLADEIRPPGGTREGGEQTRMKRCPECYLVVSPGAGECPECGHRFQVDVVEHRPGELVEFRPGLAPARPSIAEQQAHWNVLEAQRQARGFREGWTFVKFRERFGFNPLVHRGVVCDPSSCGMEVKRAVYDRLMGVVEQRGMNPGWAAHRYREMFGVWPRFPKAVGE